jgi:hypothetical protein
MVGLLVPTSSNQRLLKYFFYKHAIFTRRSTVMSLPLQKGFPVLAYSWGYLGHIMVEISFITLISVHYGL